MEPLRFESPVIERPRFRFAPGRVTARPGAVVLLRSVEHADPVVTVGADAFVVDLIARHLPWLIPMALRGGWRLLRAREQR